MEMDIDQDFDDFELGLEDLLVLQQEEDTYISSQRVPATDTDTQLNSVPPIERASTNDRQTPTKSQSLLNVTNTFFLLRVLSFFFFFDSFFFIRQKKLLKTYDFVYTG